jgi:arylformamidase
MCADGAPVDRLDLEVLCGPALVLELRSRQAIDAETLAAHPEAASAERLLLRTDGSELWEQGFTEGYPHLTEDAARWLRSETRVRLVGIDTWSIEGWESPGFPVHRCLLCEQPTILIVEGLDLSHASPGWYDLCVLPLAVLEADGAPARAVLAPRAAKR